MCTEDTSKKAQSAWNGWLDERDLAPGEVIANWLKRHTGNGMEIATEYAKAGLEKAVARADVAFAGRSLLDSGGPAEEALNAKLLCDQALSADSDLFNELKHFHAQFREEAAFEINPVAFEAKGSAARRVQRALEILGEPPPAPQRSPVEQDALSILQLRQAKSQLAKRILSFEGGGSQPSQSNTKITAPQQGRTSKEQVQELLQELFRLHDLKENGVLEEEELIKMNEKVSVLHFGVEGTDKAAIREKYSKIFRDQLDPDGRPVPFAVFRDYMQGVLSDIDPSPAAQVMMLEQFIEEARSARESFRFPSLVSESDYPFMAQQTPLQPPKSQPTALSSSKPASEAARSQATMADRVASEAQPSTAGYSTGGGALPTGWQPEGGGYGQKQPPAVAELSQDLPAPVMSQVQNQQSQSSTTSTQTASKESVQMLFGEGEYLQVWSNSKNSWLDGHVLKAFPENCRSEGFAVPAGTLKVTFGTGTVKWIMPGQAASLLRRRPKK